MGAIAAAVIFAWLGMVVAISFLEAPLKFQAPGITIPLGLGIGRLVFRALNAIEIALAAVVLGMVATDPPGSGPLAGIGVAVAALAVQTLAVRPALRRRSDAALAAAVEPAGGMAGRSRAHYVYAGLEVIKVAGLLVAGVGLQAGLIGG